MSRIGYKLGNTQKFFNKLGSDASRIGKKLSTGVSGALGSVSKGARILSKNPILNRLTNGESANVLGSFSTIAGDAKNLANYKNYSGGLNKVSKQILEKADKLENDTKSAFV